jgi:hypothetical protein
MKKPMKMSNKDVKKATSKDMRKSHMRDMRISSILNVLDIILHTALQPYI